MGERIYVVEPFLSARAEAEMYDRCGRLKQKASLETTVADEQLDTYAETLSAHDVETTIGQLSMDHEATIQTSQVA